MFYNYKVISFEGQKYFYPTKASLFKVIDDFGYRSFFREFCNEFVMNEGHVIHSEVKCYSFDDPYHQGYGQLKNSYRNGNFIIRNFANSIVDIEQLLEEYMQSRNIKAKQKWHNHYVSGYKRTSRSRCKHKQAGLRDEQSQNEMAMMEGVKIRTARKCIVDIDYYMDYYHEYRLACYKSWKSKKVDKQWKKNEKISS